MSLKPAKPTVVNYMNKISVMTLGKKKDDKKKGSKSGNPAKRAAENSGLSYGSETTSGSGSSFGLGK
jgi:hypothetical protein